MNNQEHRLTLADLYVFILAQWRWLLATVVFAGVITAITILVLPDRYEAQTRILVSRTRSRDLGGIGEQTVTDTDSFAAALESVEVLTGVLKSMSLDQEPYNLTVTELARCVDLDVLRRENSIRVSVTLPVKDAQTPVKVAEVANTFSREAERIGTELIEKDIQRSRRMLDAEFETATSNLEQARERFRNVKLQDRLFEMETLITSLGEGLTMLLQEYATAKSNYEQEQGKLEVLDDLVSQEVKTIKLDKSLSKDHILLGILADVTGASATNILDITMTEEIANEVYINLRAMRDESKALVEGLKRATGNLLTSIDDYTARMEEAQKKYAESEESALFWKSANDSAQMAYGEVFKRRELAAMAITTDRQDLVAWVQATVPEQPVGPGPLLAGILASFVALFLLCLLLALYRVMLISTTRSN
jgi:capsular polysaccharide biosynthesis protein